MAKGQKELQDLREEIDGLDRILLKTLRQRFKLVLKISKIKQKLGLALHQKNRWEELMKSRLELAQKLDLDSTFISTLFKNIHKESKRIQSIKRNEVKK